MALLENEGVSAEAATQPDLFIYEPEVVISEDQDVYKVQYEIDSQDSQDSQGVGGEDGGNREPEVITINDDNSVAAAASPSILNLDNDEPEVITVDATEPEIHQREKRFVAPILLQLFGSHLDQGSQGVGGEDGGNSVAAAASPSILNLDNNEPEVITVDDDDADAASAKRPAVSPDECPAPLKKSKKECGRPDTPRPEPDVAMTEPDEPVVAMTEPDQPDVAMTEPDTPRPEQGYSDEDERSLQMYQEKLLRESLGIARNTYLSLTDLLLYKLRRINFNSETSRDMLASLKVLGTLNRLYRAANLELDRHREDDFGSELFDI
jgi:hypothetical protein